MNNFFLIFAFSIVTISSRAQKTELLTVFYNEDTTRFGFKNHKGEVVVTPEFSGQPMASKMSEILAVENLSSEKYHNYYLSRSGKAFGKNSVFYFDNTPDCESEGFIRFLDSKTQMVGLFNRNGEVVIPPIYNTLSEVRNGMLIALKDARMQCVGCEHFQWEGGKQFLIDTTGRILIDDFLKEDTNYAYELNLYSAQITNIPQSDTTLRRNFKASDGRYYSFIDFDKEFKNWLRDSLLKDLSLQKLIQTSIDGVTSWNGKINGQAFWINADSREMTKRNYSFLKEKLLSAQRLDSNTFITNGMILLFAGDRKGRFSIYYDNCGKYNEFKYPVKKIVFNTHMKNGLVQDNIDFLRTEAGYKLLSATIYSTKLR